MSDRKLPPSPIPAMDDDSIIFEKKKSASPTAMFDESFRQYQAAVRERVLAAMQEERFFDIEFCTKNSKFWWSHSQTKIPLAHLADAIVEAVQKWPTEHIDYTPRSAAVSDVSVRQVTYDRYVRLHWADKKVQTSLRPDQGQLFFEVMAYLVEQFKTAATPKTGGAN